MRESGFIEGKNIIIERRFAEAKPDRYPDLVADLIALRVDVIVTSANSATLAAKQANPRIPIVMMNVSNPLRLGIVASLALPGGNITGVTQDDSEEIATKRLQILKDVVPNATRVAVLMDPDSPGSQSQWQQLEQAVRSLNVTLRRVGVRQRSELERVLAAIGQDHPDALFVANSELNFVNRSLIMEFAVPNRLPTISSFREYPEAGGLISYGFDRTDQFRRAAIYVGKILKGKNRPTFLSNNRPSTSLLSISRPRSLSGLQYRQCYSRPLMR